MKRFASIFVVFLCSIYVVTALLGVEWKVVAPLSVLLMHLTTGHVKEWE